MNLYKPHYVSQATIDRVTQAQAPFGPLGDNIHERTYARIRSNGQRETWTDTVLRCTNGNMALQNRKLYYGEADTLFDIIYNMRGIPGGRQLWNLGTKTSRLSNCFVAAPAPTLGQHFSDIFTLLLEGAGVGNNYSNIYLSQYQPVRNKVDLHFVCSEDHKDYAALKPHLSTEYDPMWDEAMPIPDSAEGWVQVFRQMVDSHYDGTKQLILDATPIRPSGTPLKTKGGKSSGPLCFVEMMLAVNAKLNSMITLPVTTQDMLQLGFAIAKCIVAGAIRRSGLMAVKHWSDPDIKQFITCKDRLQDLWTYNLSVAIDDAFLEAVRQGQDNGLYNLIVERMCTHGEPGLWHQGNAALGELEPPLAPNLCAEFSLQPSEPCNLASINLANQTDKQIIETAKYMTRFLVRSTFAPLTLEASRDVVDRNRRIGLGVMGFHEYCIARGIRYSEAANHPHIQKFFTELAAIIREEAREYCYELRIPECVKVIALAPTGSTSFLPGVTSGIQPIYSRYGIRRVRYSSMDPMLSRLRDEGVHLEPCMYAPNTTVASYHYVNPIVQKYPDKEDIIEQSDEITVKQYLDLLVFFQTNFVDNAISFTLNVPADTNTTDDLKEHLLDSMEYLKGITVMPEGARPQSPEERITREQYIRSTTEAADWEVTCGANGCGLGNEEGVAFEA